MKRFLIFVALVVLAVFGISRWNGQRRAPETFTPVSTAQIDLKDVQSLTALNREYTELVKAVVPSVVSITTIRRVSVPQVLDPLEYFFGQRRGQPVPRERVQNSLGSGVIVSKEGHILTNNHVVANMDEVKVWLHDGRDFPAKVIGTDPVTDIAVLKIDAPGIRPLPLGDSDQVSVGSIVFAIGNPFGLRETVTQGIISATGRQVSDENSNEFFQTDTAINPGNSGGPLVNIRGEIIGINSAIGNFSGSGTWQGVGFAIPANAARHAMDSIVRTGRVVRGYLGVVIQDITPELAEQFGIPGQTGALIGSTTPGSPADKAGLKAGDVVTAFNGKPIKDIRDLFRQVSSTPLNSKVEIRFLRDKKPQTVTATIAEQPAGYSAGAQPPSANPPPAQPQGVLPQENPLAGIDVVAIPPDRRSSYPDNVRGVMVTGIEPGSSAENRLQPGDAIEEVARQPVESPADFARVARTIQPGQRVMLSVARGRLRSFVVLQPR